MYDHLLLSFVIASSYPVLLTPNFSAANVDWALLNFMKDWFPIEAKEKLKQNEREAAQEQLQELGFSHDAPGCLLM